MKGQKAKLPSAIFEHDFSQLAKREPHARTRVRFLAFAHLQDGNTITNVSKMCRVDRKSIYNWLKRLGLEGIDGLQEKKGRGANTKLPLDQHEAFKQAVLELQNNRNGGRIRGSDVLALMRSKFNISCHPSTVYKILARADLAWISGRSIHPKANLKSQEEFKKTSKIMSWNGFQKASILTK